MENNKDHQSQLFCFFSKEVTYTILRKLITEFLGNTGTVTEVPIWSSQQSYLVSIMCILKASLIAHLVKNPPAMQETPVWFLGREDPLENG